MATVAGATKATVITATSNILIDILRENVTDPKSRGTSDFIKNSFPNPSHFNDCKGTGVAWTFPLIIVEAPDVTREPLSVDRVQTRTREDVTAEIEIYAVDSDQRLSLSDSVLNALYSNASSLSTGTLQNMQTIDTSNDTEFWGTGTNTSKIRIKRITVQFQRVD